MTNRFDGQLLFYTQSDKCGAGKLHEEGSMNSSREGSHEKIHTWPSSAPGTQELKPRTPGHYMQSLRLTYLYSNSGAKTFTTFLFCRYLYRRAFLSNGGQPRKAENSASSQHHNLQWTAELFRFYLFGIPSESRCKEIQGENGSNH